jgi:spermidine/putrescine transport system permease protein
VICFLFLPIIVVVMFSFNDSMALSFPLRGLSLRWYAETIGSPEFHAAIGNTAIVGLTTSLIVVVMGTLAALAMARYSFRGKSIITGIMMLPMSLPPLFIGLSLLSVFTTLDIQLSLFTVVIGHIVYTLPYFVLVALSRLQRFDVVLEEAARDLGASSWLAFWKVTFPIIGPSVLGGGILVFALSFDEFLITFLVVGTQSTLPMMVWSMMRHSVSPAVNAVSTIVLVVALVVVFLADKALNVSEIRF